MSDFRSTTVTPLGLYSRFLLLKSNEQLLMFKKIIAFLVLFIHVIQLMIKVDKFTLLICGKYQRLAL